MKRKNLILIGLIALLAAMAASVAMASERGDLADVRAATARFRSTENAQAAGMDLVPGLDYCFENPGVGGMGYHYINTALLDTDLDPRRPEAMVYSPNPDGQLNFAAVEFIVPADAWGDQGNTEAPELLGQSFHLNEALGVYVLHAWIWKQNPAGMFEDWNPEVSCP